MLRNKALFLVLAVVVVSAGLFLGNSLSAAQDGFHFSFSGKSEDRVKLYWLTADGLRADKDLFNMYKWAKEGKLPNIKKLMDRGTYGYSVPDFPSLTSNNIATLHTGASAKVHGIIEGAMRVEGHPLEEPVINGFSSVSKKVSPIWSILEKAGKKTVILSVPGSTPPEVTDGVTIRGRWGNWGFDTPAVTFEPRVNYALRRDTMEDFYFFTMAKGLTRFVDTASAQGWAKAPKSFSEPIEATFSAHGGDIHAYVYDSTNDKQKNYDRVLLSSDKKEVMANLREGEWSGWLPVTLNYQGKPEVSTVNIRVIKIWPDGRFRIRALYNALNNYMVQPSIVAQELTERVGPMVDFLDNCLCLGMAPQLIVEPEDKQVALDEARMSWSWHAKAAGYIVGHWKPDALIEDFYTPNQMLVSRWWMGDVDPKRAGYSPSKAKKAWKDLLEMYRGVDSILGKVLENADKNTLIVLSSEHGTAPLYRNARINNLFAKKGWLTFSFDKETGKATIDWKKTKAVFIKMSSIYLNPNGLSGNYVRSQGPEYEAFRKEVMDELRTLKDDNGVSPVSRIVKWEDADSVELPADRVGDLIVEATTGYRLWEEMTDDKVVFTTPRATGYKEGVNPLDPSMQTPFLIAGPGVKKGVSLSKPIRHRDQLPTILNLMNVPVPGYVEGHAVEQAIQ